MRYFALPRCLPRQKFKAVQISPSAEGADVSPTGYQLKLQKVVLFSETTPNIRAEWSAPCGIPTDRFQPSSVGPERDYGHCCVQILNKKDLIEGEMVEQIKREIAITKDLKHPNVVDLKEVRSHHRHQGWIYSLNRSLPGNPSCTLVCCITPVPPCCFLLPPDRTIGRLQYCKFLKIGDGF